LASIVSLGFDLLPLSRDIPAFDVRHCSHQRYQEYGRSPMDRSGIGQ
jgi:hypothetical protein